jgi:hypothetical protein
MKKPYEDAVDANSPNSMYRSVAATPTGLSVTLPVPTVNCYAPIIKTRVRVRHQPAAETEMMQIMASPPWFA